RMLSLTGRLADGWMPSLGYFKPADLLEGNRRIDEAAKTAGRDPRSIRRLLNAGILDAESLVALDTDIGMDTFLVADDPVGTRTHYARSMEPSKRTSQTSRGRSTFMTSMGS